MTSELKNKKLISLYDKSNFNENGAPESEREKPKKSEAKQSVRNSTYLEINNLRNKLLKGMYHNVKPGKNLFRRKYKHSRTKSENFLMKK